MANCGCPAEYLVGSDNRKPLISNTVLSECHYEIICKIAWQQFLIFQTSSLLTEKVLALLIEIHLPA